MSRVFIVCAIFLAAALIFGVLFLVSGSLFLNTDDVKTKRLKIGKTEIFVYLADTKEEQLRGLSGGEMLEEGEGMLFVFETNDFHPIWMRGMKFPIDIIWIDEEFTVVDIQENVLPSSFPEVFTPDVQSRFILETNAGWVKRHDIRRGSRVEWVVSI